MIDKIKKLLVIDTNVLMHDPTAIFRFKEHDVYLPIVVLEELDRSKKGLSEVARNVRQVSRFIDELIEGANGNIAGGLELPTASAEHEAGHLFFHMDSVRSPLPHGIVPDSADNMLLGITHDLSKQHPDREVVLVTKDINLRIKAHAIGISAEDYTNDQVLDDTRLLITGMRELANDFWESLGEIESWKDSDGKEFYRIHSPEVRNWYPNQFIYLDGDRNFEAMVRSVEGDTATVEVAHNYVSGQVTVWGIRARNREQNFALNLLMDPDIDFVTLLGQAGTGKTLLTLAAGLSQTMDEKRYNEIIMTRVTVPVGEDIGFLPGTEEEKMNPWMGALEDNLDVLNESGSPEHGSWGRAATKDFLHSRIRIKSLNFMRGRTFQGKFIIIDEAQNLTSHQMKTLVTRAGPGSKVICLGNNAQIDTPYLTEASSGITYVVDRFKHWEHSGHVTLMRGERSRLADYATKAL